MCEVAENMRAEAPVPAGGAKKLQGGGQLRDVEGSRAVRAAERWNAFVSFRGRNKQVPSQLRSRGSKIQGLRGGGHDPGGGAKQGDHGAHQEGQGGHRGGGGRLILCHVALVRVLALHIHPALPVVCGGKGSNIRGMLGFRRCRLRGSGRCTRPSHPPSSSSFCGGHVNRFTLRAQAGRRPSTGRRPRSQLGTPP